MRLIFIRHGETTTNAQGFTHRANDSSGLTQKGKQQIEQTFSTLKKQNIEVVYTSPEKRGKESAVMVSEALEVPLRVLEGLRERNWGVLEGESWETIEKILKPMSLDERYRYMPPKGESWQQMEERLKNVLDAITAGNERCVAIFTHTGTLRAFMPILKNAMRDISFRYTFENASITTFDYINDNFTELMVNDISHLGLVKK